jgi:putative ABC transport system permease protein
VIQPGYFATMNLAILRGRALTKDDTASSAPVVVINEAMADRQWPGENPVGHEIHLPGPSGVTAPITVVGVSANSRQSDWTAEPDDEVFLPIEQRAGEFRSMTYVLRTSIDPSAVASAIPQALARTTPRAAVSESTTMGRIVTDRLWRQRLSAGLMWAFAGIALALAAAGIYAVVGYSVARRRREFGVRLALGATRREIQRLALVEGLCPVVIGVGLGAVGARVCAHILQSLLFNVSALSLSALVGASVVLFLVAALAAWWPAFQASRLDPTAALQQD